MMKQGVEDDLEGGGTTGVGGNRHTKKVVL